MAGLRAAIYCRVSTAQQEPGTSIESQKTACLRLAQEIGADVVAEFQDVDSGAKENIPGLLALTDAAARRDFDLVLVDHPDRFSRNLVKKVIVRRDLAKTGVEIRYAALRVDDSAEGRLMENMTAVIAEYERERIEFRTNRGRYAKARSGRVVGTGAPPYGYEYVREDDRIVSLRPDPITAPIARRVLADLLVSPATTVVKRLNDEGIPPPRGVRWHEASILKMAHNTVYSGRAAYGQWEWQDRKVVGPRPSDEWVYSDVPPLIGRSEWSELQEMIGERRLAGRSRLQDDPYLLRGRLVCDHCGGRLATHLNNRVRYYACLRHFAAHAARQRSARCELASVNAAGVEETIVRSVRGALLDPQGLHASMAEYARERSKRHAVNTDAITRDIERYQHRLSQAQDIMLDARPGSASWLDLRRKAQEAEAQIARLEHELDQPIDDEPISDETIATLEAFATIVREEADSEPMIWQELFAALRVRVTVRNANKGAWKIGRRAHFELTLQARPTIKLLQRKNVFSNIAPPQRIEIPIVRRSGNGKPRSMGA